MKIKKKLRDLLPCEYEVWIDKKCHPQRCTTCVFANVVCSTLDDSLISKRYVDVMKQFIAYTKVMESRLYDQK